MEREDAAPLMKKAVAFLTRREHTRRELADKFRRTGEEGPGVEAVLDRLEELGYLSDRRFAEGFVRARAPRFGAARLRLELARRGVDPGTVSDVLAGLGGTEAERARLVWLKRFSEAPADDRERARQTRFLAARGFSYDAIKTVLRQAGDRGEDFYPEEVPN